MQKFTLRHLIAVVGLGVFAGYLISCGRTGGIEVVPDRMVRRPPDPLLSAARCGEPTPYGESAKAVSLETANIVHSCSIISGTIGGAERRDDFFRIDVPRGPDGQLKLTLVEYRANWAPTLELYDASQKKIATARFTEPGTARFVYEHPVEAGKTYYWMLKDDVANKTSYRLLTEFFPR